MTADVTVLQKFFHPHVVQGFAMLADPKQSVECELVAGKAAGPFRLERALFGISETVNSLTGDYTFRFPEAVVWAGEYFQLRLLVKLVYSEDGGNDVVFGWVSHSQWEEFPDEKYQVGSNHRWVIVKYSMDRRDVQGKLWMSRQLYELLKFTRTRPSPK